MRKMIKFISNKRMVILLGGSLYSHVRTAVLNTEYEFIITTVKKMDYGTT